MESTEVYIGPEPHIEVHKYYSGIVPVAVLLALVLQAFLPVYIRSANYLELPLLVTLYFALSKRNPSSGLILGMVVGLGEILGGVGAPAMAGRAADLYGLQAPLMMMAACAVVGTVLALFLRETAPIRSPQHWNSSPPVLDAPDPT